MRTVLAKCALLGAASGMRSTIGLAAVVSTGRRATLPGPLTYRLARPCAMAAVGAEMVVDKLSSTGSRLEVPGMAGRLVFAGAAGALLASRESAMVVPGAAVAVLASALAAKITHDLRAAAANKVPDRVVAVAEDVLATFVARLGAA